MGFGPALYTGFLFFPLMCSTSSYRASSLLAWCCLRGQPQALLESQLNESRGAAPGLLPVQAEPDRGLYYRQLEPHATPLPLSGRVFLTRLYFVMCCFCILLLS